MATYTKFQSFVEVLFAMKLADPWDNATIRLRDRYKKPIQQFSSYRRSA